MTCPVCHAALPPKRRVCPQCGHLAVRAGTQHAVPDTMPSAHTQPPPPTLLRDAAQLTAPSDTPLTAPPPPALRAGTRLDNTFAWFLALTPLVSVLLEAAAYTAPGVDIGYAGALLVGFIVIIICVLSDTARIREAGGDWSGSPALGILLLPIYLIVRTIKSRNTPLIPATWFASLLLSLVGTTPVFGVPIDTDALESQLQAKLPARYLLADNVQVDCPDRVSPKIGESFRCVIRGAGPISMATVTVESASGDLIWQYR